MFEFPISAHCNISFVACQVSSMWVFTFSDINEPSSTHVLYKNCEILMLHFPTIQSLTWYLWISAKTRHWLTWITSPIKMSPVSIHRKHWLTSVIIWQLWYHATQIHNFYLLNTKRILKIIQTTGIMPFLLGNLSSGNGRRTLYCGLMLDAHYDLY